MTKRMLIDATHPEETRVVLMDGNQLEDFDVEVSSRRQLKGNIYLAKVIRVEPSLQAAFVDYGGNRHGFLAFSEIHPDYYQIPVSDREEALEHETVEDSAVENGDDSVDDDTSESEDGTGTNGKAVETIGGDEADEIEEAVTTRRIPNTRQYKIQEVIKRRQVLLIQVVKEERGNKGAALTTYMSLAGRYCVLMPNTERGGGISRKITNSADRKQLKEILSSLDVPEGMAVILRTAGIGRTKAEIKRDFEYLIRLWNNVRDLTLQSTAPTLVHEEGDIVRRSIRDLYSRDIEDVQVEGEAAYKAAKEFMKLLIPSHARRVKHYKETDAPLLRHFGVESQLDAMHNPIVHLPSGGYLVINPTEALVSVDVNSGKSTKERNIEETALKTNLEAADALARQLRLRDLAGLVVIDFIDMDINRNNSQVERRMKEALKHDRARIQVGRISPFGLLEMSRQRLRPSLIETSSEPCPHCAGSGIRRSTESTALVVLRAVDEEGAAKRCRELTVHVPAAVALYILNHKRDAIAELETKYYFTVILINDDSLIPPDLRLERTKNTNGETISEMVATQRVEAVEDTGRKRRRRRGGRNRNNNENTSVQSDTATQTDDVQEKTPKGDTEQELDAEGKPKRRRRSRRGGRRRRKPADAPQNGVEVSENNASSESSHTENSSPETKTNDDISEATDGHETALPTEGADRPKRRRRRRPRKPAENTDNRGEAVADTRGETVIDSQDTAVKDDVKAQSDGDNGEEKPKPRRPRSRRKPAEAEKTTVANDEPSSDSSAKAPAKRTRKPRVKKAENPDQDPTAVATPAPTSVTVNGETKEKPKRKGWWNIGS